MSFFRLRLSSILLAFLFISSTRIFAQHKYNFEHISIPDGLSNNSVNCVVQDRYGFLWVATTDGLNRYDGYNFKIYKNDPGNKKSLPSNDNFSLLVDNNGTLWIGTFGGGLAKFNYADETFSTFYPDSNNLNSQANNILNIAQDSKNRIWLLTQSGIFTLDRATYKIKPCYLKDGKNKIRITTPSLAFLQTSSGDIYSAAGAYGIIKYNEETNLFENVNVGPENPFNFNDLPIFDLSEDKTGKIWISSATGLYNYDPHTGSFNEINLFKKVKQSDIFINAVTDVFQSDDGILWIAAQSHGIYLYNMKTSKVRSLDESEFPATVNNSNRFFRFYKDGFGILWITTFTNGLLKLDFQKEPFRLFANSKGTVNSTNNILSIYKPDNNRIAWLGTDDGLLKYNMDEKSSVQFINIKGKTNSIPGNAVRSIADGSAEQIWLGTNSGLSMMNTRSNAFTNYDLTDKTNHYDISYNNIRSLSMDAYGNLWAAAGIGMAKFNTRDKTKQFIPNFISRTYNSNLLNFIASAAAGNPLAGLTKVGDYQNLKKDFSLQKKTDVLIVSVGEGLSSPGMVDYGWLQNSKGDSIWTAKDYLKSFYLSGDFKNRIHVGLLSLKKDNYVLRYISDDSHSYGKWNAEAPIDSALWGIQVFDLSGSNVNNLKSLLSGSGNRPFINTTGFVQKVKYQNDGTVLIGTSDGLFKYDIRKNSVENLQNDSKTFSNQNLKRINDIYVDRNKIAWIGTDGGLIKYDENKNTFKFLYDKNGLPSNYIMAIEEDSFGNLWLSTLNGISKFNKDTEHPIFINYDVKDGLQGYSFNRRSSFKSKDGELFFAGPNGFNTFHSSNINKMLPKINITQLKVNNEVVTPATDNSPLTKSILNTKYLDLPYSQNNISFDFTAIQFSRPEKNQYAYMLEGFDKKGWIYDNRRFATYTNLPPGNYVFKVKASNGDGIWNEKGTSIHIKVFSPWWRTVWAYIGYAFVFGFIVFGVDRIQRRRLLAKEKVAAQIREAELRAQIAEKESERKSYELEEARKLQLSMLPKEVPHLPNLSIAVYMKTATEVGGDYYDFHLHLDGTLTVILGDATGHGMMSGMMVSIMKSLFMSDRSNRALKPFFENASAAIKDMRLGRLMMALSCVQFQNHKIITTNAGMPPLFIYRKNTQSVEEVALNNMPLGAMKGTAYDIMELDIEQGDVLLLMSDGFAELKNEKGEMFGYRKARNSFEETARKEPDEIVEYLKNTGIQWTNDEDPEDDVTFVVIKVK
ncbi:MAG: two-component regulator propeller domain-containing protein [Ignavibacteriaceae bacterium]